MIGKIARSGATFYGALTYCRYEKANVNELKNPPIRGEIIHHQNIFSFVELEDRVLMKDIALEMEETASMNSRIKKPVSHISLSFPPGESPDHETLANIVKDYSKVFGFEENGLMAFKHTDKHHEHLHIIANKINTSGWNSTISSYDYLEMGKFTRIMENKYNLQRTNPMDSLLLDGKQKGKSSTLAEQLRNHIDKILPASDSLQSLQLMLLQKGFKSRVANGISFTHKATNTIIKGSDLGREYSKLNLIKRINGNYETNEKFGLSDDQEKEKLRLLIRELAPKSMNFEEFESGLKIAGYGLSKKDIISRTGKSVTSIMFSKDFSGEGIVSNSKVITGSQLGASFRYDVISENIDKVTWSDSIASRTNRKTVTRQEEKPSITSNTNLGLDRLFTSINAGKVEADASRSQAKIVSEINRNAAGHGNELGSRGIEEIEEEKKKNSLKKKKKH